MINGAVRMLVSHRCQTSVSGVAARQNRSRSSALSSTRNAQPCEKPADGARTAWSRIRSRTSGGTGRSGS